MQKIRFRPELFAVLLWMAAEVFMLGVLEKMPQEDAFVYQTAKGILEGTYASRTVLWINSVFAELLSFIMRFVGVKWTAVCLLRLLLRLTASSLLFAGIRKVSGRACSVGFLVWSAAVCIMAAGYGAHRQNVFFGLFDKEDAVFWGILAELLVSLSGTLLFYAVFKRIKNCPAVFMTKRTEDPAAERKQKMILGEKQILEEEIPVQNEIQYIPNPLPLPKKHVKKEIQFDYDPPDELMKFDHELEAGKDEFDI